MIPSQIQTTYDYIIVGGGSAGCVLASRLSADAKRSVLLIEAGKDAFPGQEPADILDPYPLSSYNPRYFWPGVKAAWRAGDAVPSASFPQAQVLGGGSAVAGMVAFRGTPEDYDEWAALGAQGWSWSDVLPYFCKLESDQDFNDAMHGRDGPIPIRRVAPDLWPALTLAAGQYATAQGLPFIADMNADFRDGFGATPISNTAAGRVTTAAGYLTPAVRQRDNLRILSNATVRQLTLQDRRACGVVAEVGGQRLAFTSMRDVILSAGAIHSPALLLRAGVGDAEALRSLGVEVVAHLSAVGCNLRNHSSMFLGAMLRPGSRQAASLRTHPTACMRLSSGVPGAVGSDVYVNIQSKTSWNAMGRRIASLNAVLLKPAGAGQVRLASADGGQPPRIDFAFGNHASDVQRLADTMARIVHMLGSPQLAPHIGKPFVVRLGDRIRNWNVHKPANAAMAMAFGSLLDVVPQRVADRLVAQMTGDTIDLARLCADPEALFEFVKREMSGVYHPVGTCRMGQPGDPSAVVDPAGRVIGVGGLRIIDASIMPTVPRGNTNIPTIMLAEKLADAMLREAPV